jgi:hypothetical protein
MSSKPLPNDENLLLCNLLLCNLLQSDLDTLIEMAGQRLDEWGSGIAAEYDEDGTGNSCFEEYTSLCHKINEIREKLAKLKATKTS